MNQEELRAAAGRLAELALKEDPSPQEGAAAGRVVVDIVVEFVSDTKRLADAAERIAAALEKATAE